MAEFRRQQRFYGAAQYCSFSRLVLAGRVIGEPPVSGFLGRNLVVKGQVLRRLRRFDEACR